VDCPPAFPDQRAASGTRAAPIPFAAIDMALVHNGDFANYHSVSEYLKQRQIYPQFLTDTEVSALLFDLLSRTYHYPLEYIIEALAPTTELDFDRLDAEKRKIYRRSRPRIFTGRPMVPGSSSSPARSPGKSSSS